MEIHDLINSYGAGRRNFVGLNLSKSDMNGIDLATPISAVLTLANLVYMAQT